MDKARIKGLGMLFRITVFYILVSEFSEIASLKLSLNFKGTEFDLK